MRAALISLGSNVGDRAAEIRTALDRLANATGVRLTASSSLHETKPAGGPESQEIFLNAAALLETSLPPRELLSVLQRIEIELGRVRDQRWGPRTIDIDLLLYDQLELETPELKLPHPRMSFRRFVLEPAAEIAAEMVHPVCGNTIGGLLTHFSRSPRWVFVSDIVDVAGDFADIDQVRTVVADRFPRYRATASKAKQLRTQWLAQNNDRLMTAIKNLQEHQWVVSDWWWEVRSSCLPLHDLTKLRRSRIAVPRLLVVGPEGLSRREVQRLVYANIYRGPLLWLEEGTSALLRDEVLAAIAAME